MKIKERIVENPKRHKLIKISSTEDETVADIEKFDEGRVEQEGTLIDACVLNEINWRSDKTLSFKVHNNGETSPESKTDEVQIFTNSDGETWLLPAGIGKTPIEIGRTEGTKVKVNGNVQDVWNADTKQNSIEGEANATALLVKPLTTGGAPQERALSTIMLAPANPTVADMSITGTMIPVLNPTQGSVPQKKSMSDFVLKTEMATQLLNFAYPVGSIFMSVVDNSPENFLGGTWVRWGAGRVPLGMGQDGGSNFSVVETKGGAETHTLTIDQMPSHQHKVGVNASQECWVCGGGAYYVPKGGGSWSYYTEASGGGLAHNNMQPYITCFMWKRTA